jgi:hypothetical protein
MIALRWGLRQIAKMYSRSQDMYAGNSKTTDEINEGTKRGLGD